VIGADLMTRVIDHDDRTTAPLFGDGAGAAVVARAAGGGAIRPGVLGSDAVGGRTWCASSIPTVLSRWRASTPTATRSGG